MLPPEGVDGPEGALGDELHLREEDVAALLCGFASKHDEETTRLLIGQLKVIGGEMVAEEVEGRGGLGGGGGRCGLRDGIGDI